VIILFILGMMAQGHLLEYDLSKMHILCNTLQAIAIGYLISSIIFLHLRLSWQIIATAGLMIVYWALMRFVPVPGYGAGVFTPDGNLAVYLDKLILGHFQDAEAGNWTYILTSMTFGANVMLGLLAGQLLRSQRTQMAKVSWLAGVGIGCLVLGLIWGIWFPIIHHLWTSSMVLLACGWSFLLLALFYLVIDVWGYRKWAFAFVVIGMNCITVYMATYLFDFRKLGDVFVGGFARWVGPWNEFIQAVAATVIIWLILYWMYRKRTFIKI
jgi:predicted acyltransferase